MLATAATAAGLFTGTNIDDIVVLTLLVLVVRQGALTIWQVWLGQYVGVGALIILSLLAAAGLSVIPERRVGLLGLIPLALGLWGFYEYVRSRHDQGTQASAARTPGGLAGVIGITMANGADNIAVYTPVFRTRSTSEIVVTIVVFLALVAVWVAIAQLIGTRRRVIDRLARVEGWLVPAVFCALGLFILIAG